MSSQNDHQEELVDAYLRGTLDSDGLEALEADPATKLELEAHREFSQLGAPLPGDTEKLQSMIDKASATPIGGEPSLGGESTALASKATLGAVAVGGLILAGAIGLMVGPEPQGEKGKTARSEVATMLASPPQNDAPKELAPGPAPATPSSVDSGPSTGPNSGMRAGSGGEASAEEIAHPPERQADIEAGTKGPGRERGPKKAAPKKTASAGELLVAANQARRDGEFKRAETLYRELSKTFSGSRESGIAMVNLGRLNLEHFSRPKEALENFEAYLRSQRKGTLAEEAQLGRARALQALGRTDAEREAWGSFIERFPASPHVVHAKERLVKLGEP